MTCWSCILVFLFGSVVVSSNDPCLQASDISNEKRSSTYVTEISDLELCDDDIDPARWYKLGGNMTSHCVLTNRCGTYSPIWLDGDLPTGTEVVSAKVCSGGTKENCCSWESEVEIKKCGDSFVYKLKKIDNCPMAYCIGEDHNIPECEDGSVLLKKKRICLGLPIFDRPPLLSTPYISSSKKLIIGNTVLNASIFSFDCSLNPQNFDPKRLPGSLQMETVFKMNEDVIANFSGEFALKTSINESYLIGHLGKTLTCLVRFYYVMDKGISTEKSEWKTSNGFYLGVVAMDEEGKIVKDMNIIQGKSYNLTFKPTFPLTMGHCLTHTPCHPHEYVFTMDASTTKIFTSVCKLTFSISKQEVFMRVYARTTFGHERSTSKLTFQQYNSPNITTLFSGYIINPVTITINDNSKRPTCRSTGDPHFSSFQGTTFNNYDVGDFNLLSVNHGRHFEIQVRQLHCGNGRVTCNCGVIAREGNNLLGVSACDKLPSPLAFELMRDNVNARPTIEKEGNSYYIQFVSGISMRLDMFGSPRNYFMNIYVYGLKTDSYSGICAGKTGSFDAYRIQAHQSYFQNKLPSCVLEINEFQGCSCCSSMRPENMLIFPNVCDLRSYLESSSGSSQTGEIKLAIDEHLRGLAQGFTEEDIFATVDHKLIAKEKDVKLITTDEAKEMCNKVFVESQFYAKCKEFLKEDFNNLEADCMEDVEMSGEEYFAKIHLTVFERVCREIVDKTIIITDTRGTPEEQVLLDMSNQIKDGICPVCFNGGLCKHGKCECAEGYGGVDCFHNLNGKPVIAGLQAVLQCDLSQRPCHLINLEYRDIVTSSALTLESVYEFRTQEGLHFNKSRGQASITEQGYLQTTLHKSLFASIVRSRPVVKLDVHVVVKDGSSTTNSNTLSSIVFDGVCMACKLEKCLQKDDSCLIDNECYKSMHSFDDNLYCDPSTSRNSWTKKNEKGRHLPWVIILVCSLVVLVLIVVIAYFIVKNRCRQRCCT